MEKRIRTLEKFLDARYAEQVVALEQIHMGTILDVIRCSGSMTPDEAEVLGRKLIDRAENVKHAMKRYEYARDMYQGDLKSQVIWPECLPSRDEKLKKKAGEKK